MTEGHLTPLNRIRDKGAIERKPNLSIARDNSQNDQSDGDYDWLYDLPQGPPYPDDRELVGLFFHSYLEAQRLITEKIAEWKEVKESACRQIKENLTRIQKIEDSWTRWFCTHAIAVTPAGKRLREAMSQIKRLERLKAVAKQVFGVEEREEQEGPWKDKVARAKQVPILDAISGIIRVTRRGKHFTGLCPFHNDKNPSLYIYPETNRFHCFGCQKGGDAIEFVRLHFGYDFKEAVKYLTGGCGDDGKSIRQRNGKAQGRSRRRRTNKGMSA